MPRYENVKVAVIVSDGFEQVEFDEPVNALREAGVQVDVLAEDEAHLSGIRGMRHLEPAEGTQADRLLEEVRAEEYDALLIPGGLASPDAMRRSEPHLELVEAFMNAKKPTFAICHAGWLLADSGVAEGRRLTSWKGIRRDMERAGATWVDEPVVVDGNLVTSRKPKDIPRFIDAIFAKLDEVEAKRAPREGPRAQRGLSRPSRPRS